MRPFSGICWRINRYERTLQRALAAFNQAISLDPNLGNAQRGRGEILLQLRRYEEALEAHEKALQINPEYVQLYVRKGYTLERLAQQAFEKARQLGYNEEEQLEPMHSFLKSASVKVGELTQLPAITFPHPNPPDQSSFFSLPPYLTTLAVKAW